MQIFNAGLISADENSDPTQVIDATAEFVSEKLREQSTAYRRKKQFRNNELFVSPKELTLGLKWEMIRDKKSKIAVPRLTQCKFQYVPMIDTIRALFKRRDFRKAFMEHNIQSRHDCIPGIYKDFCCGKLCSENELFSSNPLTIRIQIANDDFEICNPLGSKATIQKLSAFYFTIQNIPPRYRSSLNNIFILCICHTDDLKTEYTDINYIWRLVTREISYMETVGIDIGDGINLKGALTMLSFDNLGANQAFGFVSCFISSYYCRFCEMSISECRSSCREDITKRRTIETYNKAIERIKDSNKVNYKETIGVKMECALNELNHFHILKNWSVDIMHDLNEGIIPFAINLVLKKFVESKILSVEEITQMLQYFDYGFLNQRNVPSKINLDKTNLNQNATQMKCMFQHIPYIFWHHRDNASMRMHW